MICQFNYDLAGRVSRAGNDYTVSSIEPGDFISSLTYTARGQMAAVTYGNGVITTLSHNDQRGWLSGVLTTQGATTLLDLTYPRNGRGMITGITSPDATKTWTYGYDSLQRLASTDRASGTTEDRVYRYDDADNMVYNSGLNCGTGDNMAYPDGNGVAAGQGLSSGHPHGIRLSAPEVESAVAAALRDVLADPIQVERLLGCHAPTPSELKQLIANSQQLAASLHRKTAPDQLMILRSALSKVTIGTKNLIVEIKPHWLAELADKKDQTSSTDSDASAGSHIHCIDLPMRLGRRGNETRLII